MILIEHDRRRQLVNSLAGHDGAKVIKKDIPDDLPPEVTVDRIADDGSILPSDPHKDEVGRLMGLTRPEFLAEILARMTDELSKRDAQIAELAKATNATVSVLSEVKITPADPSAIAKNLGKPNAVG